MEELQHLQERWWNHLCSLFWIVCVWLWMPCATELQGFLPLVSISLHGSPSAPVPGCLPGSAWCNFRWISSVCHVTCCRMKFLEVFVNGSKNLKKPLPWSLNMSSSVMCMFVLAWRSVFGRNQLSSIHWKEVFAGMSFWSWNWRSRGLFRVVKFFPA